MKFAKIDPTTGAVLKFPVSFKDLQDEFLYLRMYSTESINYNVISLPKGYVKVYDSNGLSISDDIANEILGTIFKHESGQYRCTYTETINAPKNIPVDPLAVLNEVKNDQLRKLASNADTLVGSLTNQDITPQFEIQTWTMQTQEALAWEADNTVATPMLDAIATARGVPSEVLKQKTLEKVKAYQLTLATIVGKRQAIEDQILVASTPEEVLAISVILTL
jgi:hypothetical protein